MKKNNVTVLGVMSGTSLDGLDLALCRFKKVEKRWEYEVIETETIPYPHNITGQLNDSIHYSAEKLAALDSQYAKLMATFINKFLNGQKIKPDYIASHGHTVFHQPSRGFTTQIGSGATIAALTGITTISDFRSTDVALGGQGAPLVPIGDELLFGNYRACINLGGFSNISYSFANKRIAYDISPCNLPLNLLAVQMGLSFDRDGTIASQSHPDKELVTRLNQLDYYQKEPPKSLGYEWLQASFFPILEQADISIPQKMRSVIEHIAIQLSNVINNLPIGDVMITGGGAHNKFLMRRLKTLTNRELIIPEKQIVNFKEAIIFALLGILRVREEINCYASVTGASKDSCCGAIYTV
ncbi:anhydro-N-acetylmuramic acid kinase [Bacteroidales bacterium OttesenSCG-928-B11]|nr:anhydro-N-acetylmuramic acid kinase [Bacteroidales bacterium OttesenSCG-928-C03]MDL2313060.1 anhydro-N-acetylmuramic acid kinase [Bacteroidales bacterium OttesenSCG-928-B11]